MTAMEMCAISSVDGRPYQEFLRSRDLSVGVYRLKVGAIDSQEPHKEDDIS